MPRLHDVSTDRAATRTTRQGTVGRSHGHIGLGQFLDTYCPHKPATRVEAIFGVTVQTDARSRPSGVELLHSDTVARPFDPSCVDQLRWREAWSTTGRRSPPDSGELWTGRSCRVGEDGRRFDTNKVARAFNVDVANVRHLGTGAFGETWWVRDRDGTQAACKIIYIDGYAPQRLEREVAGLSRVNHTNVVRLLSRSTLDIDLVSRPVLKFEYIDGGDLATAMDAGRKLETRDGLGLLRGLLEGVNALHHADVVHRDIKPHNIALRHSNITQPVLLDLGLARPLDASTLTRYPGMVGTMPYMAPEQLRGEKARLAADLYAVGVVLLEALTGQHPYWRSGEMFADPEDAVENLLPRQNNYRVSLPSEFPGEMVSVLNTLMDVKAHRRSTPARLLDRLQGL
jgi:eukaryotic-like serine/threonine-protein kinase